MRASPARRYIVVSAPGKNSIYPHKVTDVLYEAVQSGCYPYTVEKRFAALCRALSVKAEPGKWLRRAWRYFLRTKDGAYFVSRGEYICARILAAWLAYPFLDAGKCIAVTPNGRADEMQSIEGLQQHLYGRQNAVLPGFYGRSAKGRIGLLRRGGSDVTGALLASAVHATLYENWTDVSGFYTADPRCIVAARPMSRMRYTDARELAHLGAQVLHEDAISPAERAMIPIWIRNTFQPTQYGTLIQGCIPEPASDYAVTTKGHYWAYTLLWKEALEGSRALLSIAEHLIVSETGETIALVLAQDRMASVLEKEAIAQIEKNAVPLSLLAITGFARHALARSCIAIYTALREKGIFVLFAEVGASSHTVFCGVPEAQQVDAWKVAHQLLCEKRRDKI